jgi:glycylpeptide N-tetradecanoyltransferase
MVSDSNAAPMDDGDSSPTPPPADPVADSPDSEAAVGDFAPGTDRPKVALTPEHLVRLIVDGERRADPNAGKQHAFWSTQPVPQLNEQGLDAMDGGGEPIETKAVADVRTSPLALIPTFEWSDVDVTDDAQLEEAYQLLNLHYVEDGEQMFRFDYSRAFLRWALMPPGWRPTWHVGVRVKASQKLVALITAIPATIAVHGEARPMVEINFLCVHKKLRAKRLAPVLIQEITRRVNLQNVWQAVYTAGALLPRPVSSSRYYHRSLNPKKLIEIGFSRIAPRMTLARTIKLNALAPEPSLPGIRPMTAEDVPAACKLLMEHNEQFELRVSYSEADVAHWFLPRDGVVYSYVVERAGAVTDLCSFYSLPSSIIRNPKHKTLNAAYSFCNVAVSAKPHELMQDALVFAHRRGFDVFNALDLAKNDQFLDKCKFHVGDGDLNFYVYNWKCRSVDRRKNTLVLL